VETRNDALRKTHGLVAGVSTAPPLTVARMAESGPTGRGAASESLAALRRFKRRLEIERSFIERTAGNRAADALALVAGKLLNVFQAVDAPAGDDRNLQFARKLDRGLDID